MAGYSNQIQQLYMRRDPTERPYIKVEIKWPEWFCWTSHLAFYTGDGPDRELLDVVPVDWWTGKAKINFEKLQGHGNTPEDPLTVEPRYKTILDWLGLGYLIIGRDENDLEE